MTRFQNRRSRVPTSAGVARNPSIARVHDKRPMTNGSRARSQDSRAHRDVNQGVTDGAYDVSWIERWDAKKTGMTVVIDEPSIWRPVHRL